nr:RNA-directed DNA polymerase, eukaryota [Tanacetum cinerariifolium]
MDKDKYKVDLEALDTIIDQGNVNEEIVKQRSEIVSKLLHIDKLSSVEMAQKAKIKWSIESIMVDGSWVDEPSMVKREFFNHFRNRFDKPYGIRAITHMEYPRRISLDKQSELEGEVPNDEIKRVVWDCGTDKAPGPDGFTFGFYRRFWYLIDNDMYAAVKHFFIHGEIPKGFFKVDFEKAYDSVRWDFLDDILGKFGFGDKWRMWIQSCLKSSRGSIIGSPTEEFQFFKGLKQGPTVTLSHMFYADDAVFVGKWYESNITTLVHVLDCFHRASGLKINMSKSKILGVHVESDRVKEAALRLGCISLKTLFLYLGSKVGGSMSQLHEWDEVVKRVKMRLSKWKMKYLSIGGRLTLLKSVLRSMTIFNMSIFKVPLGVLRTLESIRSHFFNGHALGSNKASWVSWKKVLSSKDKGGLGVSSLHALNRGLLFKWIWRFYTQDKSLWVRVIKAINCFPRLYTLESCKRITVGEKMRQPSLEFSFRRNTRGGVEQEQLGDLVTLMHDVSLSPMADRWNVGVGEFRRVYRFIGVETSRHLFFSCNMVRQTTRMITRWVSEAAAGLHGVGDSRPDMSFETSASPEYMSGLYRASLTKVVSCVSPSLASKETIPHYSQSFLDLLIIRRLSKIVYQHTTVKE